MAFEPLNTKATDIKKEPNKPYVGHFIGRKYIDTDLGKQVIWMFTDQEGNPFSIYGFTNLNLSMEHAKLGVLCRIKYTGTKFMPTKYKPKGQDVHQVFVEVDNSDVIPVVAGVESKPNAKEDEGPEVPF